MLTRLTIKYLSESSRENVNSLRYDMYRLYYTTLNNVILSFTTVASID